MPVDSFTAMISAAESSTNQTAKDAAKTALQDYLTLHHDHLEEGEGTQK
jgi:hypothetical protein